MSTELGKIEKPEVDEFKAERKLYLVPLIFSPRNPSSDYADLYERYWSGAREHLMKLEHSMGPIARVYHDSIGLPGEEGLSLAEKLNDRSASVARNKVEAGATFEAAEDQDLVAENLDWQKCLLLGLESRTATERVWGFYSETMQKRYDTIAGRIEETLKPEEAGLLFISEEHKVQFPAGLRVFYVAPPALDEIHRWLRDQRNRPPRAEDEAQYHDQDETGGNG